MLKSRTKIQIKAPPKGDSLELGSRPPVATPRAGRRVNLAERQFKALKVDKEIEAIRKAAADLQEAQNNLMSAMNKVTGFVDGSDDKIKKKFKKDEKSKSFKCKKSKRSKKKSPKKPAKKKPTIAKMMRSKPRRSPKKSKRPRRSKCGGRAKKSRRR
jgi:hypothetical protein